MHRIMVLQQCLVTQPTNSTKSRKREPERHECSIDFSNALHPARVGGNQVTIDIFAQQNFGKLIISKLTIDQQLLPYFIRRSN